MTQPENPPAFPSHLERLRDEFAMTALTSLMRRSWDHVGEGRVVIEAWAHAAYATADAMLAERAKDGAK